MGPPSELSPVDPARTHPLLPKQEDGKPMPVSVQDLRKCVEFIKSEVGDSSSASPEAMAQIFVALFERVHPLAIGAIQQSYALARLISKKPLSTHMDAEKDKATIDSIVDAFSDQFFSHHYRIGWKEAEEVGLPVSRASDALWEVMWALYKHYQAYFTLARDISDDTGEKAARPIVWIDSIRQRRILEEILVGRVPTMTVWQEFPWKAGDQLALDEKEKE